MQRTFGWISAAGFLLAAMLLGKLAFDLGRLHAAIAAAVGGFYLGFLAIAGRNVLDLARGIPAGALLHARARWSLAVVVPLALLGSVLDCMGLGFESCAAMCGFLMRVAGPATSVLFLVHAVSGVRSALLAAGAISLSLLVPNRVCRNPVNRGWMELLGQSPACYASSFAVILLAGAALMSRRRIVSALLLAWGVVAAEIAFWIGHHDFRVPW